MQVKLLKQIELKNKEHNDRMKSKEREMMQLKKQVCLNVCKNCFTTDLHFLESCGSSQAAEDRGVA